MVIDVGDIIFYKDQIWKVKEITINYFFNNEIFTIIFEDGNYLCDDSSEYIEIQNNYVKDDRCILPKAKYRELRINQILE